MTDDRVAPELRGKVPRFPAALDRAPNRLLAQALLSIMPSARVDGVVVEKVRIGGQGARLHRPDVARSRAALLWIHGGGLIIGRAVQNDRLCGEIAREAGIVVLAIEYRKAPRHPFPAPLDDCRTAWTWIQREAVALGVDPGRVVVGGESAGGGLAAALTQWLHDEGGITPVGQLLFCPMLDDRTAARRHLDLVAHPVWDNRQNRYGWRSYLRVEPGAQTLPAYAAAARRDDLSGLPPAWIGVSAGELFRDEAVDYADRLRAAGVAVEVDVVPGGAHGFETWAPDAGLARGHVGDAVAWLRRLPGVAGTAG